MTWSLTVAAIIEQEGRFLFVEEREGTGPRVLNQPAGHVEVGEPLLDAVVREVAEETGLAFTPEGLVGIYQLRVPNGKDYVRVCYSGSVPRGQAAAPRDADILACHWYTLAELRGHLLRSPLVMRCLEDWMAGRRLPLDAAATFVDAGPRA